jgi:hypothetical protein
VLADRRIVYRNDRLSSILGLGPAVTVEAQLATVSREGGVRRTPRGTTGRERSRHGGRSGGRAAFWASPDTRILSRTHGDSMRIPAAGRLPPGPGHRRDVGVA